MPIYPLPRRLPSTFVGRLLVTVAIVVTGVVAAAGSPRPLRAQTLGFPLGGSGSITAGGEMDNYLRYLQSLGQAPLTPWSLRTFAPRVIDTLRTITGNHPWRGTRAVADLRATSGFSLLPVVAATRMNTAYPVGSNDGPVWAGRGVTGSLQGGVAWRGGPLSVVLDPMVFVAQNASFALQPNGYSDQRRFDNGDFPVTVDNPQRFGAGTYARVDPGESTIRVDALGVGIGVTTAEQTWGPATTFPFILGNNAPGVPHAFIGTNHPTSIGIGRVQLQAVYGMEFQSSWSAVTGSNTYTDVVHPGRLRFMSGLVGTFTPGAIPGLEVGAARYFHQVWTGHVTRNELVTPFEGLLKGSLPVTVNIPGIDDRDALKNQLASLFARWVLPNSGFEVYGEYGHEDHNYDLRDLAEEPDHSRVAMMGLRKAFAHANGRMDAFRAEYLDGYSPSLVRHRGQGSIYVHNPIRQGHTENGQLLGADVGVGSIGGAVIAFDHYAPSGRTSVFVLRRSQDNFSNFYATGTTYRSATDGMGSLGVERVAFHSWGDVNGVVATQYRGGAHRTDAARGLNLNIQLGVTLHPGR